MEKNAPLCAKQFGFRRGRSTVGAMHEVYNQFRDVRRGRWRARILVDVRNAFNMANWGYILEELEARGINNGLVSLIAEYLSNRQLEICRGTLRKINMGVPQGSVLDPLLWNILHNGVLRIDKPVGTKLLAYADDLGIAVIGETEWKMVERGNKIMRSIDRWLIGRRLQLVPEKTEAVVFTARKAQSTGFRLRGETIPFRSVVKYLGRGRENGCSADEAYANVGGPAPKKRGVLGNVVNSVILYAVSNVV